jgi:hypothetical protein
MREASDEYEEEDSDFTYNNNFKSSITPTMKKLNLVSNVQE